MTEPDATVTKRKPRYLLHAGLFLATFITTSMCGALNAHQFVQIAPISDGLSYSVPLLLILVCHEFGHFFAAKAHGVEASLPFFIPFPFGLGTLGAVIGMRKVTQDRRKLIDIGAAGPLAGLAVAIPVILYGLSLSPVSPVVSNSLQEGNSLLYALLKFLSKGAWLPGDGKDVYLHPTAWAGWAGLLVTMINLMPIGQLDGGHIATAYFGNNYQRFARGLHRSLPLVGLGVFVYVLWLVRGEAGSHWDWMDGGRIAFGAALPWLIWFGVVALVGGMSGGADHPTVEDEVLPRSRRVLFWVVALVFVGIFMPVPYRGTMGGVDPTTAGSGGRSAGQAAVAMKVTPFDLPLADIRASLESLRRPLRIAVMRARNPFNVGAIIRVAHSFLVREIVLVGTEPYYQRASMGMERFESVVSVPTEEEFLARARAQGGKLVVFEKESAQCNLWQTPLPDDCTMVFGSEVEGVSPAIIAAADLVVAIPMYGINHSFPVTVAAGIAMAEWTRQHYEGGLAARTTGG